MTAVRTDLPDPRLDPAALTPPVSWEVERFLAEEAGVSPGGVLPVGRPGKVGVLDVTLGADARNVTGLASRFIKAPMQLTRPLYVDPADPGEAFLYVRTTGGGLAQNDRIRQVVRLEPGARATVTTQAGTPVHRMNAGFAGQWVSLHVPEGAVCEYLPGQSILFAGSRLVQVTDADVAPGGTLIAAEMMLTGRLARGERDGFDLLSQGFRVERAGRPLLSDTLCVVGAGQGCNEMQLAQWPVWGTVMIVPPTPDRVPELLSVIREVLEGCESAAASTMVGDAGVTARVAGEDPVQVRALVDAVAGAARVVLLGRPAVDLRRM
ncbi:MAG TPA: urease accessory protein UreD [Candidatus Corynebacterium avicola]|uniref:Urease accessory protein UreD n=1 Tax=Candidatus Corynebacterium avicola TaxID=2838527 RepID=A0A9D1RNW0_9CORY|nr:urease accessory protein UreD [Candidatus Corynebacterium avicola]